MHWSQISALGNLIFVFYEWNIFTLSLDLFSKAAVTKYHD